MYLCLFQFAVNLLYEYVCNFQINTKIMHYARDASSAMLLKYFTTFERHLCQHLRGKVSKEKKIINKFFPHKNHTSERQ